MYINRMNQTPPRQRIVRIEPPSLIRIRRNVRRNIIPFVPILEPLSLNVSNMATIAHANAYNINSNSNGNVKMPNIKKQRLNNTYTNKKNGNKKTKKNRSLSIYKNKNKDINKNF
jgi:hypothetical protein